MNGHRAALLWAMLAVDAQLAKERPSRVRRCDPTADNQTPFDCTAVCRNCKRRLTMDDMGGGPPGGPFKPLPECKEQP